MTNEQFEEIRQELAEAKAIADKLWAVYLDKTTQPRITIRIAVDAWEEYNNGLEQAGICPTLIGYRFKKNLKPFLVR